MIGGSLAVACTPGAMTPGVAPPALPLTESQRGQLRCWLRSPSVSALVAKRARIVLLAAEGLPNIRIGELVGCHGHTVAIWRERFAATGPVGLLAPQLRPKPRGRVRVGPLRLDPAEWEAWRGKNLLQLTPKEFVVLEALMRRPGQVLTHLELQRIWNPDRPIRSNTLVSTVCDLRAKIDRPFGTHSIETVEGVGFRLRRDGGE